MLNRLKLLFTELSENHENFIAYYNRNKRVKVTYSQFHYDIDNAVGKLNFIQRERKLTNIGILGQTSYMWMVLDYACIKGGFRSVGIPETYSTDKINLILGEANVDILLCDYSLKNKFDFQNEYIFFYNVDNKDVANNFDTLSVVPVNYNEVEILKDYSIVFSSGTSDKIKKINRYLYDFEMPKRSIFFKFISYVFFKFSFWSRKDNMVIIFLPFSHPIQRDITRLALIRKINVLISDPANSLKHIISNKPNILIAVPQVYDAIASNINFKLNQLKGGNLLLFKCFNILGINKTSNSNPIKKLFLLTLFKNIRKIYGGRADYFVVGSSPVNPDTQRTFYKIGVKLLQAYGQTESGNVMSTHRNFKIGSVGKPDKGSVSISPEGEVLMKYDNKIHDVNKHVLNIGTEGRIHTGDLGYIDKQGYLFITGRKDEVIVLSNGKKIFPANLEMKLVIGSFNFALVSGSNKNDLFVILSKKEGLQKTDLIIEAKKMISNTNSSLNDYEQIKEFYIAEEGFSIENGMLTANLKMKRKFIYEKYKGCDFIRVK